MQVNVNDSPTYDIVGLTEYEYKVITALVGHLAAGTGPANLYNSLASEVDYRHPAIRDYNGDMVFPFYIREA